MTAARLSAEEIAEKKRWTDTEFANGERLLQRHGAHLRYRKDLGWFAYDEISGVWRNDEALVRQFTRSTITALKIDAANTEDQAEADRMWKWAKRSQTASAITNAMAVASADPALRFDPDELDSNPRILNAVNGIVHLQRGRIYDHRPEYMMTRMSPTRWSPTDVVRSAEWDAFLETALPDPGVRSYVQKAVGYSITGETSMECLFFIHGPANAGKSTFIAALQSALGEYAATVSFEIFLRRRDRDPAQELASLRGRRFVASVEVQKGKRFAEEIIKAITGGDKIRARFLYREPFEYRPTWKLWLVANDQPKADTEDEAFWRRIVVVPFTHPPKKEDRILGLKDLFATDAGARAAVLAWAVEGAHRWYTEGKTLLAPQSIVAASEEYREVADELADFYLDCLEFDPALSCTPDEVWQACRRWCESHGVQLPWQRSVADGLRRRSAESVRTNKGRLWLGVHVKL